MGLIERLGQKCITEVSILLKKLRKIEGNRLCHNNMRMVDLEWS